MFRNGEVLFTLPELTREFVMGPLADVKTR